MLLRFNMNECKFVSTPLGLKSHFKIDEQPTAEKERREMDGVPYRLVIGRLMYWRHAFA